jgi:glycosyltransferase involved in cell wall biosynthesis
MRILFVANVTPWPAHGGIHLRILNLLERTAQRHHVVLGCHVWNDADRESVRELNARGIPTVGGTMWWASARHVWPALKRALRGIPPETAQYQAEEVHALIRAGDYDVIHIEESILAPYLASVPAGKDIRSVITLHNVHFVQGYRIASIEPFWWRRAWVGFSARWMAWYEPRMVAAFDRVITVTEDDRRALQAVAPAVRVDVVPNGTDTVALQPLPAHTGRPALLFIGSMAYRPCIDAASWLVREILPAIQREVPDVDLWIVGKHPTPEVLALGSDHVFVTGEVDDVRPYYERCTVAVAPLRAGGGSRLKILEAMALGRPVVSTTIGAEGLDVVDGEHIAIADDAQSIAARVLAFLADEHARASMVAAARALVVSEYDWDSIAAGQLVIYEELLAAMAPSRE